MLLEFLLSKIKAKDEQKAVANVMFQQQQQIPESGQGHMPGQGPQFQMPPMIKVDSIRGRRKNTFEKGCVGDESLRNYDWTTTDDGKVNIKDFFRKCKKSTDTELGLDSYYVPESDTLGTISAITGEPVRYTSEALKYAQTSFWCSIVIMQWAVLLICKTRTLSFWQHGLRNASSLYGFLFETGLMALLVYVKPFNYAFGTRQLDLRHFGVNAFPFFIIMVLYDEGRKCLMRWLSRIEIGKKPRFSWIYRNTYY